MDGINQCNGHELEQTPGDSEERESGMLAAWMGVHAVALDTTQPLNNNNRYRLVLSSRDTEKRQGKDKENTYEVIIRGGLLRWYSGKESAY